MPGSMIAASARTSGSGACLRWLTTKSVCSNSKTRPEWVHVNLLCILTDRIGVWGRSSGIALRPKKISVTAEAKPLAHEAGITELVLFHYSHGYAPVTCERPGMPFVSVITVMIDLVLVPLHQLSARSRLDTGSPAQRECCRGLRERRQ